MNIVKFIYKPVVGWAAHQAIVGRNRDRFNPAKGRFMRAEVDRLLVETWRTFDQLAPGVPREPTVGSRMNILLSCLSLAFFQSLLAAGVERDYAIELFADAAWKVYAKWAILPRFIARLISRDPQRRMNIAVGMFLRFPFNPPAYRFDSSPARDSIAVNIRRCPVAEYFRARGAADLCVGSWCNLDYGLAQMWGGWLERGGTLAGGAEFCDFRFKAARRMESEGVQS